MQCVLKSECRPAKTDSSVCDQRDFYRELYNDLLKVKEDNHEYLKDCVII